MKFQTKKDELVIIENRESLNSGSVNYYEIDCEFDESWNGLTKEAIMVEKNTGSGVSIAVINNRVLIDRKLFGIYSIGLVGYTIENEEKVYQISTNLQTLYFNKGAGEIETTNSEDVPTPTEWEIYISQIEEMADDLKQVENINIDASKSGTVTTVTITNKDKETKTVEIYDGERGPQGLQGEKRRYRTARATR